MQRGKWGQAELVFSAVAQTMGKERDFNFILASRRHQVQFNLIPK